MWGFGGRGGGKGRKEEEGGLDALFHTHTRADGDSKGKKEKNNAFRSIVRLFFGIVYQSAFSLFCVLGTGRATDGSVDSVGWSIEKALL